ncbi:glycosyltransferase family 4 protein [Exiguobacterium sp. s102]|uniref:glycosyltransferase family 4 protein n=1 Tax=Exiguobacterium sp. s102 TaxID=2751212 RepID=UPI001BE605D2|nr:glycosyltransferase family 4 protein [Exiguobacterium sp. s102]
MKITIFRPGIISNGSAFEAQAMIYKYLQKNFNYEFVIIKDENDDYFDEELKTVSIPKSSYQNILRIPYAFNLISYQKHVLENIKGSDLIITCDPTIYHQGRLVYNISKKLKIPYIFDSSVTNFNYKNKYTRKIISNFMTKYVEASKTIWITVPKVAERFNNERIMNKKISENFFILGHPVDIDMFKPNLKSSDESKQEIIVLCISRLIYEKGIQYIIYAIEPLIRENPKIKLKIMGQGNALPFLKNIVKNLNLIENIEFLNNVKHSELPIVYKNSDIFISHPLNDSNWEEYFGVANIEAMSCGLPTISSNSGGVSFVLREVETSLIIQERDVVKMTQVLRKLIEDEEYRKDLGAKSRDYVVNNYSLESISEKYHRRLEDIMLGE